MRSRSVFLFFSCLFCFLQIVSTVSGQEISASPSTIKKDNGNNVQLQQQLLLSRKQQLELNQQEQQKLLLEKQKQALAEKEKQLMEMSIRNKQHELEQEKKTQTEILQKNQLQAKLKVAVKDQQIHEQELEIRNDKQLNVLLLVLFTIVAIFAAFTFYSQRKTKRLNAVISVQHDRLEQMGKVKNTLLGVVSHDLRAPVNTLFAFADLLNEEQISQEKLGLYLEQISVTLNHTSSMMNNLLNWASSQMEGFSTDIKKIDPGSISKEIFNSFIQRAETKTITLINHVPEGNLIMADQNMLDLILRNLLSNALKYTNRNGTVKLVGKVEGNDYVISISDNGIGMDVEKMNRFNQSLLTQMESTSGTAKEKGTGLGLMLCQTFAGLMSGKLTVHANADGIGTVFELRMPIAS